MRRGEAVTRPAKVREPQGLAEEAAEATRRPIWMRERGRGVRRPTSALRIVVILGPLGATDVVGDEFLKRVQPLVELFGRHRLLGFACSDNPRCCFEGGLPGRLVRVRMFGSLGVGLGGGGGGNGV